MSRTGTKIALTILTVFVIPFISHAQTAPLVFSNSWASVYSDGSVISTQSSLDIWIQYATSSPLAGGFYANPLPYPYSDITATFMTNGAPPSGSFTGYLCYYQSGSNPCPGTPDITAVFIDGFLYTINGVLATAPVGVPVSTGFPNTSNYISSVNTTGLPPNLEFYNEYATATVGTSSLVNVTSFLSFLNVPQLLATRVPFAYIFQIYEALAGDLTSTSTADQSFPTSTFSMQFPTSFNANGLESSTSLSVNYFSTTTFTEIMGAPTLSVIRGLLGAIVWVELGFFLWRDARSKKHLF